MSDDEIAEIRRDQSHMVGLANRHLGGMLHDLDLLWAIAKAAVAVYNQTIIVTDEEVELGAALRAAGLMGDEHG